MSQRTVYAREITENEAILVSGVSDAVSVGPDGTIEVVVDWKCNVDLPPMRLNAYHGQIDAYRKSTRAARGLLVLKASPKHCLFIRHAWRKRNA